MMEEREPQWYERARKGPFESAKFTDAHADKVMRRVREGEPHQERRGIKFRAGIAAAAGILLLAGAGVLYLGTGPFGERNTAGPSYHNEDSTDVTEAAMIKAAENMMQEQLGKKLPLESVKPQPGADQVCVTFREGEYLALIWVSTETGKVTMYSMNASFSSEEIDDGMLNMAKEKLRNLGYRGEFKPDGLERFVSYGRVLNQDRQVSERLFSGEADIGYVNNEYDRAYFTVSEGDIEGDLLQTGLRAIGQLGNGGTDELSKASLYTGEGMEDEFTLFYGKDTFSSSFVKINAVTHEVLEVSDLSLAPPDPNSPDQRTEQDKKLLDMDEAKLQSAAAAAANSIFGIRLEEYMPVKKQQDPGTITFVEVGNKAPAIDASYNLEGVIYRLSIWREATPE